MGHGHREDGNGHNGTKQDDNNIFIRVYARAYAHAGTTRFDRTYEAGMTDRPPPAEHSRRGANLEIDL